MKQKFYTSRKYRHLCPKVGGKNKTTEKLSKAQAQSICSSFLEVATSAEFRPCGSSPWQIHLLLLDGDQQLFLSGSKLQVEPLLAEETSLGSLQLALQLLLPLSAQQEVPLQHGCGEVRGQLGLGRGIKLQCFFMTATFSA